MAKDKVGSKHAKAANRIEIIGQDSQSRSKKRTT